MEPETFVSGLELSRLLYANVVEPLLSRRFPDLVYGAALIGSGSEVLSYDTTQSRDHDWGPRLQLFLSDDDLRRYGQDIDAMLRRDLPPIVAGHATDLAIARADAKPGATGLPGQEHSVRLFTLDGYMRDYAGLSASTPPSPVQWLTTTSETLLTLVSGEVYRDDLGELERMRRMLSWYPHDVWLYLLAAQWARIGEEEAFPGRCSQVGDETGSRLVAGRLVKDLMRLCFLLERRYAPYIKWFGTAFRELRCSEEMTPLLDAVLAANDWPTRHVALCRALECAARLHNTLGLTEPLPEEASPFYTRPFNVIHAELFSNALYALIEDSGVLALPRELGGFDQYVDSTSAANIARRFDRLYR